MYTTHLNHDPPPICIAMFLGCWTTPQPMVVSYVNPKVMQSRWSGETSENSRRISQRILPANFSALFFQGFGPPKIDAQNSRPKLSAFLSNFTQNVFHADSHLPGETNSAGQNCLPFRGGCAPPKWLSTTDGPTLATGDSDRIPSNRRFPTFFCASFFPVFAPVHPPPSPGNFLPKILSFWDLRSTLSSREKATSRGWVLGMVLGGVAPQEKKENPFSLAREKSEKIPKKGFALGTRRPGTGVSRARRARSVPEVSPECPQECPKSVPEDGGVSEGVSDGVSARLFGPRWTTHRTGESEPRPTNGPTSGPTSGSTSGPTSPPTRAPTRADFPVFSPSRTPHETSHEDVHGRAHEWTVGVHLSCFHLFCSLATRAPECPKSVPRVFLECQTGVPDTPEPGARRASQTPRRILPRTTPLFSGTLSGTLRGHFGPEGPERLPCLVGEFPSFAIICWNRWIRSQKWPANQR